MPRAQRQEFSKLTKARAFERSGGRCECCGLKIQGTPEYHRIEAAVGGDNSLENCVVMDPKCHRRLTREETVPAVTRAKRLEEKRLGLRTKRRGFRTPPPGYNAWTRRIERDD